MFNEDASSRKKRRDKRRTISYESCVDSYTCRMLICNYSTRRRIVQRKERMRGWISIDQDQSERMINSFSSLTEMFWLAIGQSLVDLSKAKNFAPCDECKAFSSGIRKPFYLTLLDQMRWRILRDHIPQFHSLGCRWIHCAITTQQRLKWRSTRLYIPDQHRWMLWDVIGNRWPLFKN